MSRNDFPYTSFSIFYYTYIVIIIARCSIIAVENSRG